MKEIADVADKDGANNRSSQNIRAKGSLSMVGKSDKLIGVTVLTMQPNPDYNDEEHLDVFSSPGWGEDAYVGTAVELDNAMQISWEYVLSPDSSVTLFYNSCGASDDSKLREDIATAQANAASENLPVSNLSAQLAEGLDISKITSYTPMGVSFKMKFRN